MLAESARRGTSVTAGFFVDLELKLAALSTASVFGISVLALFHWSRLNMRRQLKSARRGEVVSLTILVGGQ